MNDAVGKSACAGTWRPEDQRLRSATEAVEHQRAGGPPWELSRQDCLRLATLAADCLRARGATRVRLLGSLARGRARGVHSDFDLAVEGLPPEAYLGSLGALLQLLPMPVDLVEMESASPELRERILGEGLLI